VSKSNLYSKYNIRLSLNPVELSSIRSHQRDLPHSPVCKTNSAIKIQKTNFCCPMR
jgi:hypothetical protein